MFEQYKNRMAFRGRNMSEMLRMQSNMVIEQTWDRDPNYRQVFVVKVDSGLPQVTANHELIDVKFNIKTYQSITSDEVAYMLQFRHGAEKEHPEIAIGSYVYMRDEDGEWKWWMLVHLDERPSFRQWQILECNYIFKWVVNGKIYNCLGIHRIQQSYNSGSWEGDRFGFVDDITAAWLPSNKDVYTIGYNQRLIISDPNYFPPLTWTVSKIENAQPLGITKFKFTQETFDPAHDNAELLLANYYDNEILPTPIEEPFTPTEFTITYNGTKPTIKVGGSEKVFTAQLSEDNHFDIKWSISDGTNTYGKDTYDDYTETFGRYTVTTTDRELYLKIARNYELVGTVLTIIANCADGSVGSVDVEVVG